MILAIAILLASLAAIADGMVEGYEFDSRKSFERKFGVAPDSFWGSLSWKNVDTWWERKAGTWDFYHLADDIRAWGYRVSGILLGIVLATGLIGGQNKIYLAGFLVGYFALGILLKRFSMAWIRK